MTLSIIAPWSGSTAHLVADFRAAVTGADEVVIVDDASDEVTATELRETSARLGWRYHRNDTATGFSAACNRGYALATGDALVFLNSDVSSTGWLAAARAEIKPVNLYGPAIAQQSVYGMGIPYIEGWCIGAARETWERLNADAGPWDAAAYHGPYWEDVDLSFRALVADMGLVQTKWAITHKGGGTLGNAVRHGKSIERNRATFAARVRVEWEKMMREGAR